MAGSKYTPRTGWRTLVTRVLLIALGASCGMPPAASAQANLEPQLQQLAPGQSQEFSRDLRVHEALDIDIEQLSGTVALDWKDAAGEPTAFRFTQEGRHGHILATVVADRPGLWHFTVAPRAARPVEYRILVSPPRSASPDDIERAAAGNALARAEKSRLTFRAAGGKTLAPGDQSRIQNASVEVGNTLADYESAIALGRKLADACAVRNALNGLAHFQIALGQYQEAFAAGHEALAADCADPISKAHALRVTQSAAEWLGDLDTTIDTGEQALPIYHESGDLLFEGMILGNLSSAYVEEGAASQGLESARKASDLAQRVGDREGVVFNEETIGAIHLRRGEYQLALDEFEQTLEDLKTYPYPDAEAMVREDLGNTLGFLGDWQAALANFELAQRVARKHDNFSILADALNDEGELQLSRQRYAEAARLFKQVIAVSAPQHMERKRARAVRGVGAADIALGRREAGRRELLDARAQAHALHDNLLEIDADISLGDDFIKRQDTASADEFYENARARARAGHLLSQQAVAAARRAELKLAAHELMQAKSLAEEALRVVDDQRGAVNAPGLRSTFFQSTRGYYDLMVRVLMALHAATHDGAYARAALEIAENSRAKALTDLLSERGMTLAGALPEDLARAREAAADALHRAAYHQSRLPDDASAAEVSAAEAGVRETRLDLDRIDGAIRAADRRFSDLTRPTPLTVDEIQGALLDAHSVVLEIWLSARESFLWEITSRNVNVYRLPGQRPLERLAARLRRRLASPLETPGGLSIEEIAERERRQIEESNGLSRQLSRQLSLPRLRERGKSNVVVVADGALRGIPFGLLPGSTLESFDTHHSVTYLPSVGALRWLRSRPFQHASDLSIAVVADPVFEAHDPRVVPHRGETGLTDAKLARAIGEASAQNFRRLPWTRQEAQAIAARFPADRRWIALGFAADRAAVMQAPWDRYAVAHFATHALVDSKNPQLSGIVLSLYDDQGKPIDGYLRVTDIYKLRIPVQLAVLSACDSAADFAAMGNDVFTLADAFFYAGAPRLVASLWAVNDQAAALFMSLFYRALTTAGGTPASALHSAQKVMSLDPRWHSPAYWSGFVLQGDWQ